MDLHDSLNFFTTRLPLKWYTTFDPKIYNKNTHEIKKNKAKKTSQNRRAKLNEMIS